VAVESRVLSLMINACHEYATLSFTLEPQQSNHETAIQYSNLTFILSGNNSQNPAKYVDKASVLGNLGSRHGMNRILVVDDEPDINVLLVIILEDIGFEVDVYEDASKALPNYRCGHYDLVILDIVMPTMNGFIFYKRIKEMDTKIKACFLTASETT
jgi:PleD family two-component response regulator